MDIQQIYQVESQRMMASIAQPQHADPSFSKTLSMSIQKIDQAQHKADQAIVNMVTGKQQNLHQTMIEMEQADLALQMLMQIRNKAVIAYEEIFRMQL